MAAIGDDFGGGEDGVRRITLNRPERRNAMTPEMQEELIAAMEEAGSGYRVVVFAGAGEAFCAGLDLSALQEMAISGGGAYGGCGEDCAAVSNAV